ncbi:hypothetical protein PsorP6_019354 [Peronosclerospora sorghi]|nr:hypothetical protein PsorP6_019354 [Peronosclerospora sorghi]
MRAFCFGGHKGLVHSLQFSPLGDTFASVSQDRTVRLWTPTIRGDSVLLMAHAGGVRSVAFSTSGRELVTASDDILRGHKNWARSAHFSNDTCRIASGSDDKSVKVWDTATKRCLNTFHEHAGSVNSVDFHPSDNGTTLATCSSGKSINLWDLRTSRVMQHYQAHNGSVTCVTFHPSGNYLLSTSHDHSCTLWDIREGQVCIHSKAIMEP